MLRVNASSGGKLGDRRCWLAEDPYRKSVRPASQVQVAMLRREVGDPMDTPFGLGRVAAYI